MRQVFINRKTGARRYGAKVGGRRFGRPKRGKFGGMRFKKRNDANNMKVKGLLIPKNANVKLATSVDYETVVGTTGPLGFREVWLGNSVVPRCGTGAFGGQVVTPSSNAGVYTAISGNKFLAGATEWANFYNNYYSYGSKINVEIINNGVSSTIRCVLLAVTDQVFVDQLDSLTYEELLAYPGVLKRYVGIASGGHERIVMKGFRKTKNMLGIKDLIDNDETHFKLGVNNTNIVVTPVGEPATDVGRYWYWYFRAIPSNDTTENLVMSATFKYTNYLKLTDRNFISPLSVS